MHRAHVRRPFGNNYVISPAQGTKHRAPTNAKFLVGESTPTEEEIGTPTSRGGCL